MARIIYYSAQLNRSMPKHLTCPGALHKFASLFFLLKLWCQEERHLKDLVIYPVCMRPKAKGGCKNTSVQLNVQCKILWPVWYIVKFCPPIHLCLKPNPVLELLSGFYEHLHLPHTHCPNDTMQGKSRQEDHRHWQETYKNRRFC